MEIANLWLWQRDHDLPWPSRAKAMLKLERICQQILKEILSETWTTIEFDKENMKEVENFSDGKHANWSELTRQYNIRNTKGELAKNGGQIAQE
jgi:hypothetical protein